MIRRIRLERFKKFKSSEIYLMPFTVLMGENSCGKTTVIQAVNLALHTFARNDLIQEKGGQHVAKSRGIFTTALPGIGMSDFRELYYGKISRQSRADTPNFGALVELEDERGNVYRLQISSLFGSFNLKCLSTESNLSHRPEIYRSAPLMISGFVGLEEAEQRFFPVAIRQHLTSGNVSSIIRNLVLDLKERNPENYRKLGDRLSEDFGFHLDDAEFNEQSDMFVRAAYSEELGGRRVAFDFNSSGSGYMQILQILAPIYTVCPDECRVVLLDEPDAHLHPNMQVALARSLQKIQKELNIQIIISTHSAAIIRSVKPTGVVPVSADGTCCRPLTREEEVSESIAQLDNYELAKSVISGKMAFIEDAKLDIWETADRLAGTKVFYGAHTVSVHAGRSKDDKLPFQIRPVLKEFLGREIEIHFVRDSDGLSEEWRERLCEYGEQRGVTLHLLRRYEMENYLLNTALIRRALERRYPDGAEIPSAEEIEAKLLDALRNTVIMSKYKYDDTLEDSIFKTGLLLNRQEYRNSAEVKREAEAIRSSYENGGDLEFYRRVGMGKEALKLLFAWLNEEKHLNLNRGDLLDAMELGDIDGELLEILESLKSNASIPQEAGWPEEESGAEKNGQDGLGMDEMGQMRLRL